MAFYLKLFLICTVLPSIFAIIEFDDNGDVKKSEGAEFQSLKQDLKNKLITATSEYIEARGKSANFNAKFDMGSNGITCLFTLRLDVGDLGMVRLIMVTENGKDLSLPESEIQGPEPDFSYTLMPPNLSQTSSKKLTKNGAITFQDALEIGKSYINECVVEELKAIGALNGYVAVGFSCQTVFGKALDSNGTGLYAFYAVFFSQEAPCNLRATV